MRDTIMVAERLQVVIVGAGFGGLTAAKVLAKSGLLLR